MTSQVARVKNAFTLLCILCVLGCVQKKHKETVYETERKSIEDNSEVSVISPSLSRVDSEYVPAQESCEGKKMGEVILRRVPNLNITVCLEQLSDSENFLDQTIPHETDDKSFDDKKMDIYIGILKDTVNSVSDLIFVSIFVTPTQIFIECDRTTFSADTFLVGGSRDSAIDNENKRQTFVTGTGICRNSYLKNKDSFETVVIRDKHRSSSDFELKMTKIVY